MGCEGPAVAIGSGVTVVTRILGATRLGAGALSASSSGVPVLLFGGGKAVVIVGCMIVGEWIK
jgi:hypothetical protein